MLTAVASLDKTYTYVLALDTTLHKVAPALCFLTFVTYVGSQEFVDLIQLIVRLFK